MRFKSMATCAVAVLFFTCLGHVLSAPDYYCWNRPCSYNGALACQCDEACKSYGDCCPDYDNQCPKVPEPTPPPPSADLCVNRHCSYNDKKACQCDEACLSYGDCCPDYQQVCGDKSPPPPPPPPSTTGCKVYGCGFYSDKNPCQCDDACVDYGDCCADHTSFCLNPAPPSPPSPPASGVCGYGEVPYANGNCVKYVWEKGPSPALPTPPLSLAEISAAVIGHEMIMFGDGDLGTKDNRKTLTFNFKTATWDAPTANAPRPYWGDHTTVEVYQGEMYAFAGLCCQSFCTGCDAASKLQIYNPVEDKWRLGKPIPWNVDGAMSSALINGKIYICGGLWQDGPSPKCGVYTPATNSWSSMPDMPKPMHHSAGGTDGKKLYIFGGRLGGNWLSKGQDDVQIFDPDTFTWTWDKTSNIKSLPTGRTGMGKAAYLRGEFYLMGGEYFPGQDPKVLPTGTFNLVEIYNPKTNTWREGPPMPTGLHGLHPVVYNDMIYIAGGGDHIDRGTSQTFQRYVPK
eukprot:m.62622 g.62622  ORF g.62622 m.62622 type:complete len:513 (-) comp13407_c0_seq1:714-2252(-)